MAKETQKEPITPPQEPSSDSARKRAPEPPRERLLPAPIASMRSVRGSIRGLHKSDNGTGTTGSTSSNPGKGDPAKEAGKTNPKKLKEE